MKKLLLLMAAGFVAISFHTQGAQTAQARLFCWSLRFQGDTTVDDIGFLVSLDMTTLPSGVNGELALDFFNSGYTHSTYIELDSELYGNGQGAMALDVPDGGDDNNNGFPDFFEVSQPVSTSTSGAFQSDFGNGTISATWQRDAGSATGTCILRVYGTFLGNLVFTPSFQLIEYNGPLTYTPDSTTISGNIDLMQNGNPANTFQGAILFTKAMADPTDELTLQSLVVTNASLQMLDLYSTSLFYRDTSLLTNYYGYVEFNDGDPGTPQEDYYTWMLSIDDVNDSNNNGIPDFSDDPQIVLPPRQPMLTLTRGVNNLMLQISGDINHSYDIQQVGSITSTNWQTILSISLTTDPQTEIIPRPSTNTFWRVRAN